MVIVIIEIFLAFNGIHDDNDDLIMPPNHNQNYHNHLKHDDYGKQTKCRKKTNMKKIRFLARVIAFPSFQHI